MVGELNGFFFQLNFCNQMHYGTVVLEQWTLGGSDT